ncbi:hypothetical protein HYDPIDRAFT_119542, partial [Hydnomerulius pinastri MD-312]
FQYLMRTCVPAIATDRGVDDQHISSTRLDAAPMIGLEESVKLKSGGRGRHRTRR